MGYRHSKAEILDAALAAASEEGLSRLTFGRLARRLGISDRIVVYYFPSKDDLIGEVLVGLGARLQEALGPALTKPAGDHIEFVRAVWPTLARPEADPAFALFFEAGGLAAAGIEPYRTLSSGLMTAWVDWAAQCITGSAAHRKTEAAAAIATIDGLLMMRQLAGPAAANRAARGVTSR